MKFFFIILGFLFLSISVNAQVSTKLIKQVYKYRPNPEVENYCNQNYAVVYLKSDSKGHVTSISSTDSLGNMIVPGLSFLKGYNIEKPNKTLGLFFVLRNIATCSETKRGFNETSDIIINLLAELEKKNDVEFIYHPFFILIGFTSH